MPPRDRKIVTNEVDKQFTDPEDYRERAVEYISREVAQLNDLFGQGVGRE